jgi:hypothetical protein
MNWQSFVPLVPATICLRVYDLSLPGAVFGWPSSFVGG